MQPLTISVVFISLDSSLCKFRHSARASYPSARRIHHERMQAMVEREEIYTLRGFVQADDAAYLGGENAGGKAGRGSRNKVPFVAALSLQ